MVVIGSNSAGEIHAEMEMFTYGGTIRGRPILIKGPLVDQKPGNHKKEKPALPYALQGIPGKPDFRPLNTNAGHLLATQFGGLNVPQNIVPMYASFNQHGAWKSLERALKKIIRSGEGRITLSVTISYGANADPRIPSAFSAIASSESGKSWSFGFMPHIPPAIEHIELDEDEVILVTTRYWQMRDSGWMMDHLYPQLNLPEQNARRHYAVLDYMSEVTGDLKSVSISNARKFEDYQINNILTVNRIFFDGYLAPDDPGDPFSGGPLLTVAGDQGPHVDHIRPKATSAGCNAYSNAQVLSGLGNLRKGTKK